jgi:hypothetical protein
MSWSVGDIVEIGYAIPSLYISPPVHYEQIKTSKQGVYMLVVVRNERTRFGDSELFYKTLVQDYSAIRGRLQYPSQISVGVTSDNSNLLDYQTDLIQSDELELEWVVIKEPLRRVGGQIQLIVFNDGSDALTIDGYEIKTGDVSSSRVRSG